MDITEYMPKIKNEINIYGNKIALQRIVEVKKRIIECLETHSIIDINERIADIPTKKGRPTTIKKVVHVSLKNTTNVSTTES